MHALIAFALLRLTSVGQTECALASDATYSLKTTSQNERQGPSYERHKLYSFVRRPRPISDSVGHRFSYIGSSLTTLALRYSLAFSFAPLYFFQRIRFQDAALIISP